MKKSFILLTLALSTVAFSACEDDKEPVYTLPTEFVLNTPPMAESVYMLNPGEIVTLTCSQPNYGYSAVTNYVVDFSKTGEFADAVGDTPATYFSVTPVDSKSATLQLNAEDIAKAICAEYGVTSFVEYPEEGLPTEAYYVRARASLTGITSSAIASNVVKLGGIQVFNPFPAVPGQIYFVGAPSGWTEPGESNAAFYENWKLDETGVGTNVYVGSFEIPEGSQYFRFYKSLSGWGDDGKLPSIGPRPNDGDNVEVNITEEPLELTAVPGKGAWYTSDSWAGGSVLFTVDLSDPNNYKVTMNIGVAVKEDYVYLVGSQAGWAEPSEGNASIYKNWALVDKGETGVFRGTFDIPAGELYFRVYPALTGWSDTPYSADANGGNVDMAFTTPLNYVSGQGCWVVNAEGGEITFILDTNVGTMAVYKGGEPTETYAYLVGSQAGWAEPSEANAAVYDNWRIVDRGNSGIFMGCFEIPAGDLYFRPYPALTGWGDTPYSADANGGNVDMAFDTPLNYVSGQGCFVVKANGDPIIFKLDTNAGTMTVKQAE